MEVVYERCCGLDVHQKTVVACLITPWSAGTSAGTSAGMVTGRSQPRQQVQKTVRTFSTMTADLLQLADWLTEAGCTHVAMESTGVYWKPVWNVLEGSFELLLVNAQHIKQVPGRKTDVRDCEWIADLLRHGLLRGSFVPDRPQRELRELTRYRTAKVRERSREVQRLQKTLEGANIKLAAVAADVTGKSARQMLETLVAGTTDATTLATLAEGRLRKKVAELRRALDGHIAAHQQFLVAEHLAALDYLEETIERLSHEIAERLHAYEATLHQLDAIPGVGRRTAEVLLAEVGTEVNRFPTAHHLASWAGLCPGNHESAGKQQNGRTRKGNSALRTALVEAAQAAGRRKDTYLAAQYRRLAARRGKKKAAVAVAHSILIIVYHLLKQGTLYEDLGSGYFDARDRRHVERRLVRRLESLGNKVTLEPLAA